MRGLLHLLGVHTHGCRGDLRCWSPEARYYGNGWWRR